MADLTKSKRLDELKSRFLMGARFTVGRMMEEFGLGWIFHLDHEDSRFAFSPESLKMSTTPSLSTWSSTRSRTALSIA